MIEPPGMVAPNRTGGPTEMGAQWARKEAEGAGK